jgi:glycosyltransferase involved in cell wall biosynthesis
LPIEFTGWLEDPSAALSGLDLLVVPSTGPEATTRVVPEAWAAGVPVLASNIGGIAEIMKDGWNGFLFEPGSAAELAEGIERILALTTAEIGTITRNARRQYEERFTRARYAREVCDSIVRIVGGHAPNQ